MRQNLALYPVLERGDDRSSVGVVLGVGCEHELNVQGQPHLETPNLNVPFLKNVEERDLNARLQIRQFIDRKNAAVTARNKAKMKAPLRRNLNQGLPN